MEVLQLQFEFTSTNHVIWPINRVGSGLSGRESEKGILKQCLTAFSSIEKDNPNKIKVHSPTSQIVTRCSSVLGTC